jgi:hypothetical protein
MRMLIALAVLTFFLSLVGCARSNRAAYVESLSAAPPPHPTEESSVNTHSKPAGKFASTRATSGNSSASPLPHEQDVKRRSIGGLAEQEEEAKFEAAQAKAERLGVENLTQADIDGLSYDQIKRLRGY